MSSYYTRVRALAGKLPKEVVDLGKKRPIPPRPTQASSEFLINRNLGDWGEDIVFRSIVSSSDRYVPVKYGRSGDAVAGEDGFKEFYADYQRELDDFGKRPDLLIFRRRDVDGKRLDLSESDNEDISDLVSRAVAGIEVRSSNYLAKKFRPGKSSPFPVLSFTVKVEDIAIVLNWIKNTGVPHYYVQVPFDSAYAIGFHQVLDIIANGSCKGPSRTYAVTKDSKSQFKNTIKIPLTAGRHISDISTDPALTGSRRELLGGRLLFGVRFQGGILSSTTEWDKMLRQAESLVKGPLR